MAPIVSAVLAVFTVASLAVVGAQQSPDATTGPLVFDVVSVKLNTSGEPGLRLDVQNGRFVAVNVPVKQLIRAAYTLQLYQIEGAPRWTETERFDITAVTDRQIGGPVVWTPGTYAPVQRMMQAVLADRFKMTARIDHRELPGYDLEQQPPGRTGGRLVAAVEPCAASGGSSTVPGVLRWRCAPLGQLAEWLSQVTGRLVADATGLTGRFDVELQWAPESQPAVDAPSVFTAVQEQLGLRLTPRRVRTPVLVVEAIARPDAD